ncbi:MAG: hypothetical protein N2560_06735 [Ignavibacteria bacterium]|nr:hypothetical protein [Ignavibacteria bacterium]
MRAISLIIVLITFWEVLSSDTTSQKLLFNINLAFYPMFIFTNTKDTRAL